MISHLLDGLRRVREEFIRRHREEKEAEAGRCAGRGLFGELSASINSTRNLDGVLQMTPQNCAI